MYAQVLPGGQSEPQEVRDVNPMVVTPVRDTESSELHSVIEHLQVVPELHQSLELCQRLLNLRDRARAVDELALRPPSLLLVLHRVRHQL
jgi:hypothetical protein